MMDKKSNKQKLIAAIAAAVGAGVAAWAVRRLVDRFKWEKAQVIYHLESGSQVYQTARGAVEAAIHGEGPPVLVVHGGAGGYDQGSLKIRSLDGFQYISVSRPGYLRTPIDTGKTPEEQADMLAALLDTLGIEKAAVIGTSMGGLVSMHFALRYPERCWALILVSAVNAPLPIRLTSLKPVRAILETDFLVWVFLHPETLFLIRPGLRKQIATDPEKREMIDQLIHTVYPVSLRVPGMLNDADQIDDLPEVPLESIQPPTLVIHGDADDVVPFEQGVSSAARIPNAKFLPVPQGGHYCVLTHLELTRPAMLDFLQKHVPPKGKAGEK